MSIEAGVRIDGKIAALASELDWLTSNHPDRALLIAMVEDELVFLDLCLREAEKEMIAL